jgi:hypothetical protein
MIQIRECGIKIDRQQRWHFSYPDPISAEVERTCYATRFQLAADFTGFLSRRERLQQIHLPTTAGTRKDLPEQV